MVAVIEGYSTLFSQMDSKQSLWDGVFCDLDWIQNKVYTYNEYQSWFCHLSDWHSRPVLALEIIVSHSFCTFTIPMTVIHHNG